MRPEVVPCTVETAGGRHLWGAMGDHLSNCVNWVLPETLPADTLTFFSSGGGTAIFLSSLAPRPLGRTVSALHDYLLLSHLSFSCVSLHFSALLFHSDLPFLLSWPGLSPGLYRHLDCKHWEVLKIYFLKKNLNTSSLKYLTWES